MSESNLGKPGIKFSLIERLLALATHCLVVSKRSIFKRSISLFAAIFGAPYPTDSAILQSPFDHDRTRFIDRNPLAALAASDLSALQQAWLAPHTPWRVATIGIIMVSVPVFFEAPLVRLFPWLCLLLTGGWVGLGYRLWQQPRTAFWGDLLLGFSWSWFAGAIYWGWFRWEPLWHLPIESIGLPVVLWGLYRGWGKIGNCFYLGSLLGTALTDIYFYLIDVMPYWRQIMRVPPSEAFGIIQQAMTHVQTLEGILMALSFAGFLSTLGWLSWRSTTLHGWLLSGTLFGTLLVDSLFVILAKF